MCVCVLFSDATCRIGLHQLEVFRQDLINVIKKCTQPKVQQVCVVVVLAVDISRLNLHCFDTVVARSTRWISDP